MTGEHAFRKYRITKEAFLLLLDSLRDDLGVVGPVDEGGHTVFRPISSAGELTLRYQSTMEPPSKTLFYRPWEELMRFETAGGVSVEEVPPEEEMRIAVGLHPCDVNAVLYLDKTFREDPYYMARRRNTILVALNCTEVSEFCFCSSVGTGPHLKAGGGYDMLLTDLGRYYLVEPRSARGDRLVGGLRRAGDDDVRLKEEMERELLGSLTRHIDMKGLGELFLRNQEHPVWRRTADEKCLSCTNCVMVCPTCFCHDIVDCTAMDLGSTTRSRRWDACQDKGFAKVHGGNFRRTRAARLRQFVMHKLDYTEQYGTPGTVGCGRCIRWCPTGIDLTEVAEEIRGATG